MRSTVSPMSSTTTLKLPPDLKARIAPLAAAAGKTPHAWMLDALQAQVALADLRQSFIDEARDSAATVDGGGPVFAMEDVAAYLRGRIAGEPVPKPSAVVTGVDASRRSRAR
jgi:predicted transcriptional regulator